MNKNKQSIHTDHRFQLKPLFMAIRTLLAGSITLMSNSYDVRAELPVPVDPAALASHGQAAASISGDNMIIKQISDRATLEWQSFNIGEHNSVRFDQPSATAISLNNIHQADPSRILGSLTANGQVYLVNQNGFLFGKDSQVNVNALVATTLGISEETFQRGITKVFDINNAAALQGNSEIYLKNELGQFILDPNGEKIKIQIFVEPGAQIKTSGDSGRVILAAPVVTNAGTIQTPGGQTILAGAQDKVYLQEAGTQSDIRGLLVEVGTGGEVNNIGKILAERGNASLIGFAVNQEGIASATTSVQLDGSVRLLAREGIQDPSGTGGKLTGSVTTRRTEKDDGLGKSATVTLAAGSRTSVDLDADKTATAIDAQPQESSKIEISAHEVHLKERSVLEAKSGIIDVKALDNLADASIKGSARIYLETGSTIDASGVKNVVLPMERNVVEVELRKNELRDAPLQRDGVLLGEKVSVDLRDATLVYDPNTGVLTSATIPIADIKGAVDRIARNIDERSTAGGSINLTSSGDVITQAGSKIDFSGGTVAYRDGYIETTKVVSGGFVSDIAHADPNRPYDAILNQFTKFHPKWGITESWTISGMALKHFERGYIEGKAGGNLTINTYEAMLNGVLDGTTVDGSLQRQQAQRADGSNLSIDLSQNNLFGKQNVVFSQNMDPPVPALKPDAPIPREANKKEPIALNIDAENLKKSGVRNVSVTTNGSVTIGPDVQLELPIGGKLTVAASGSEIQGLLTAPSGEITFKPVVVNSDQLLPNLITLGAHSQIDVSGRWVNDQQNIRSGLPLAAVSVDGGSVTLISEQGDLRLNDGSLINANGGAWLQIIGGTRAGRGGSIHLEAATVEPGSKSSSLILDGELSAFALNQGGKLHLASNEVVIGSAADVPTRSASTAQPLVLAPEFFQQGGFSDFSLSANLYGLKVADNVSVRPVQQNFYLSTNAATQPTGADLTAFSSIVTLPEAIRQPTDLHLSVAPSIAQNRQEQLKIGAGASIKTDIGGRVEMNSATAILIEGSIDAPAGTISATIDPPARGDTGFYNAQGIWLGANSSLNARGVFKEQLNPYGLHMGDVLPGGHIDLIANRGYIVSYAGSLIDVSGTRERVDFREPDQGGNAFVPVSRDIPSFGGQVTLKAGEGMLIDGAFKADGGTATGGGTLSAEINKGLRDKPEFPVGGGFFPDDVAALTNRPRSIVISAASDPVIPGDLPLGGNINTERYNGLAFFNNDQLSHSGFNALQLKTDVLGGDGQYRGSIRFNGDMQLAAYKEIILDTPSIETSGSQVGLNTTYAALGSTQSRIDTQLSQGLFDTRLAPNAVGGAGRFSVAAKGIDLVGGLSFNGFGQAELFSEGDVRAVGIQIRPDTKNFLGTFKFAGDLAITASQLYTATLTDYTFALGGTGQETLTVQQGAGTQAPVLSAGGSLTINAPNIKQQGTIKVPFGSINLNAGNHLELAPGSYTSVSGNNLTVPFGRGAAGINWLYPMTADGAINRLISSPPEKRLVLTGTNVELQQGAKLDLSGGGDLYAYEFIPGPGGSRDILDSSVAGYVPKFAVLPGFNPALTPIDPLEFSSANLHVGDSVYLSAGSALKEGWYTLLPAHYALLPGAYLITPRPDIPDITPSQRFTDFTGATIVSGHYGTAAADIQNPRTQGFSVAPGTQARLFSEYTDYSANQFFAKVAEQNGTVRPQLPEDAGSLAITTREHLTLAADLAASPAKNGRGGQVDISADRLAIVGRQEDLLAPVPGTVKLLADDLNRLNAPSLLLGGVRGKDTRGQRVTVTAQNLNIDGNSHLQGQEVILAARDEVRVSSGALIESKKDGSGTSADLFIENSGATNSDGALLRVSSFNQVGLNRDRSVTGSTGVLTIEEGARLKADTSMALDSTRNTVFDGLIDMNGGSLALKSSRISAGAAPLGTEGLVLKNIPLNLTELKLISTSDFDLYGDVVLQSKQLEINAARINGFNNAGLGAQINADSVTFRNPGFNSARTGTGAGTLTLNAKDILLAEGDYAISGFSNTTFNVSNAITGLGLMQDVQTGNSTLAKPGSLSVAGDLNLNAAYFAGNSGSTTRIDASGHQINFNRLGSTVPGRSAGLGSAWSITANAISGNGFFDLPGGILELHALAGDINLNNGARIDVSSRAVPFAELTRYAPAGRVVLSADAGNINFESDANIRLAGAAGSEANQIQNAGKAGTLYVQVPKGQFNWRGDIDASAPANSQGGSIRLDADNFGADGLSALNAKLAEAGFNQELSLRQRHGDISITAADTIKADQFNLTADQGKVTIAGRIDAGGDAAGSVNIYGADGIALGSTGAITAKASANGAQGGSVTLDTVHRQDAGSGLLDLSASGATIDVSGGSGGAGGDVHLRTGRDTNHAVAVSAINTRITGADPDHAVLEAARVYSGQSVITSDAIQVWKADTAAFMANKPSLANLSGTALQFLPGIEIQSKGDLTLQDRWDFMEGAWNEKTQSWDSNWRYSASDGQKTLPGFLTLRANNNLNINASLTDAFASTPITGQKPENRFPDMIQPGLSWSYGLYAGGDINLAATDNRSSPAQVVVRTGTGSIDVEAGNDVRYLSDPGNARAAAAMYTMGTPAQYTRGQLLAGSIPGAPARFPGESDADYLNRLDPAWLNSVLRYGFANEVLLGTQSVVADYPTQGGDISIHAGGDIQGIATGQKISDWLVRSGVWDVNHRPTAWGINISGDTFNSRGVRTFNQNVGALGGGEVTIEAGGDIRNLSAMLPTTGKPFGTINTISGFSTTWSANGTEINGGGALSVTAGNNIAGGEYYVGKGQANITAGGSYSASAEAGTALHLGDAQVNVSARNDLVVASVDNPTIRGQDSLPAGSGGTDSRFFTYSDRSAISLATTGGSVVLNNSAEPGFGFSVYPGTLKTVAYSGDIRVNNSMTLFPSSQGQFELLAQRNISADRSAAQFFNIGMSNTDISLLPGIASPAQQVEGNLVSGIIRARERLNLTTPDPLLINAPVPVHLGNAGKPAVIANLGDIAFATDKEATFYLPKAAEFVAGRDIKNLTLKGQNLAADDITRVQAGRNILYDTIINNDGNILSNIRKLELGGPGQLQVLAGESINLGSSNGIQTIGNLFNRTLSDEGGAAITILTGLAGKMDLAGFIKRYENTDKYREILQGLADLPESEQRQHLGTLLNVFYNEIKESASAAAAAPESKRKDLYERGFEAIKTLFPDESYSGNLGLVFSQIKTLDGGDINLAVPGGNVDVGLAGQLAGIRKTPEQLGLVVQQKGNLSAVVNDNFNVNQSRVFTLLGGDILVWSSEGSIDAGKGAKSAISAPPPVSVVDERGNIVTIFPPIVSGSGIQAVGKGNVVLAAPVGVVDAGEAGISGSQVVIAATAVIGASNIQASGGTVGVPTSVVAPTGVAGADGAAASVAQSAAQSASRGSSGREQDDKNKQKGVSLLSTDVVSYGDCSVKDIKEGKKGCGD